MPHPDDDFWISVFRKSPLIGVCMAAFGIIGAIAGFIYFDWLFQLFRAYHCAIICCTLGGMFVGLIIGVCLDSLFGSLFPKQKKKKRRFDLWK